MNMSRKIDDLEYIQYYYVLYVGYKLHLCDG